MWKTRIFSFFLVLVLLFTYCFGAITIDVSAIEVTDTIQAGETKTVNISNGGDLVYIGFTPAVSADYIFYSMTDDDTKGYLYDANMNLLLQDDDGGDNFNFCLTYNMVAGNTYYFGISFLETTSVGDIDVKLEKISFPESVVIDQGDSITAFIKEEIQLSASLLPTDCITEGITWSSDNTSLATVDPNGKVSLISAGSVNIKVTTESGLSDSCCIIIENCINIIENNTTEAVMKGYYKNAYFYFTPESTGRYVFSSSSDKNAVAMIYSDDKVLLASDNTNGERQDFRLECDMTAGTTYILQCRFYDGCDGSFDVKINKTVSAESVSIVQGEKIVGYIGEKIQLNAVFAPEYYVSEALSWTSSNTSAVTVTANGFIELLQTGTAVITVTSSGGLSDTCTIEVLGHPVIIAGEEKQVEATSESEEALFVFVPNTDGLYTFYSYNENLDTCGYIYDASMNELAFNDDKNEETSSFYIAIELKAGETYYLKSKPYFSGEAGKYYVQIKHIAKATSMVVIPSETITGFVDEYRYLSVSFLPEGAVPESVTWSSENEAVAVVTDYGRVHFISEGTTQIIATSENGLVAKCIVNVEKKPAATSVTIGNGKNVYGLVDSQLVLWYYFEPENCAIENVTWKSDNEAVATVAEDGTVSFISVGTANITVTSENGLFDTSLITVSSESAATAIDIKSDSLFWGYIGDEISLFVNFTPENCILETITWSTDNEAVAQVNENGVVTLVGIGTATITATSQNGLTNTCTITVKEASSIACNEIVSFNTANDGGMGMFAFVPEADGYYGFYSYDNSIGASGYIFDSDLNLLSSDDNSGEHESFFVQYNMEAGTTYYLRVNPGAFDENGTYNVTVVSLTKLESISINKGNKYAIELGTIEILEVVFEPFDSIREDVTWISDNKEVLIVDATGCIQTVSNGVATVTAISQSGLTASCIIEVLSSSEISENEEKEVEISNVGAGGYFYFTPSKNGIYTFYSDSQKYTYGCILDSDFNVLAESDMTGSKTGFAVELELTAGVQYILQTKFVSNTECGSYEVGVKADVAVSGIEILSLPNRIEYVSNFVFDYIELEGLKVRITWSDGTFKDWNPSNNGEYIGGELVLADISEAESTGMVYVVCGEFTESFKLTIADNPVDYIQVISDTNISYIENKDGYTELVYNSQTGEYEEVFYYNTVIPNDVLVKIVYKDGTSTSAYIGDIVDGYGILWEDNQDVSPWQSGAYNNTTVSYLGKTASLPIKVTAVDVQKIEVISYPKRQAYNKGFLPEFYGLEVKVSYTDDSYEIICLSENNLSFTWSEDKSCLLYEFEIDDNMAVISNVSSGVYEIKYLEHICTVNLTETNSNVIENIEITDATTMADGMQIVVNYENGEKECLGLISVISYTNESGAVVGYGITSNGLLRYSIKTVLDENNIITQYSVDILGESVIIPVVTLPNVPEGYIDIGSDFVAHLSTMDDKYGIGFCGLTAVSKDADLDNQEQLFYFQRQADGSYKIVNVKTKYVLAIFGDLSSGVEVGLAPDLNNNQRWFVYVSNNEFVLRPYALSDYVLTVNESIICVDNPTEENLNLMFTVNKIDKADYNNDKSEIDEYLSAGQLEEVRNILCDIDSACAEMTQEQLDELIQEYTLKVRSKGVCDYIAVALCVNICFVSGIDDVDRILAKAGTYNHENIYSAMLTDVDLQAGAYRLRNQSFYMNLLK